MYSRLKHIRFLFFSKIYLLKITKLLVQENITIEQARLEAEIYKPKENQDFSYSINKFISKEATRSIAIIDMCENSVLGDAFVRVCNDNVQMYALSNKEIDPILSLLSQLYKSNISIEWNKVFNVFGGLRIPLPTYTFEKIRCWLQEVNTSEKVEKEALDLHSTKDSTQLEDKKGLEFTSYQLTEQRVGEIWRDRLLMDRKVLPTENFFDLGGHSLIIGDIIETISAEFNLEVGFEEFYAYPTLEKFAGELHKKNKPTLSQVLPTAKIPKAEKREYYTVSHAQKRILLLEKFYKLGTSYNMPRAFTVEGNLDVDRLKLAFNKLVERHEVLRTSFFFKDNEVYQKVLEKVEVPISYFDLTQSVSQSGKKHDIDGLIRDNIKPFDFSMPPFIRVLLIKETLDKWILMYDVNHIIMDRQGYEILASDFMALYRGECLPQVDLTYKDMALSQKHYFSSERFKENEAFWLDMFSRPVESLQLPTDFDRELGVTNKGDVYSFSIDSILSTRIKQLAADQNVTLYVFLLAVFKLLLYKITNQNDICIGAPFSQRSNEALKNMVGVLLNTIVVRSHLQPGKTFESYLQEIQKTCLNAYSYGDYQFEMLLEKIDFKRSPNRNPIFDILFNSQIMRPAKQENKTNGEKGLKLRPYNLENNASTFDMSILVDDLGDVIHFNVHYKTDLFKRATIAYYMSEYQEMLKQVIADHTHKLKDYQLVEVSAKRKKLKIVSEL